MRTLSRLFIIAASLAAASCSGQVFNRVTADEFRNPPQDSRPRVWWHWEDGNITKDGIKKDLEWMQAIGIGGFHHFDAGVNQAPVVENRMVYMHDDWKDAFRYAIGMADSLGMTVGIASSPGWSNTGGPWVKEEDAMKMLVWNSVDLTSTAASEAVRVQIPRARTKYDWYRDIKTLAVKLPDASSDTVRSIRVLGNSRRRMWNIRSYKYNLVLEASDDSVNFREIGRVPQTNAPGITVNVTPTAARYYRLRDEEGRQLPQYMLYNRSRVERAEEKAGFSSPFDLNKFPTIVPEGEIFACTEDIIDVSEYMAEDGTLVWNAPEGSYRIIRFGYTLTGKKNGPAPKEATGLEVDKLDQRAYRNYFLQYLDMYCDALGGKAGRRGIDELLVDSYEAGWQTWTPEMIRKFEDHRGYSLIPWMPALSGEIIISAEATEKFLFDWRRTIGELYNESYALVKNIAAEYGIGTVCLESQENGRVFNADGMEIKSHADVPMAACWTGVQINTNHSTFPMAIADIRESASISHIYGKRWVAAESLTTNGLEGNALAHTPKTLKHVADIEFASGVNRIFIHESSHQPLDDCRPGVGLGRYGQWFSRHETWAAQAKAWTDYLARTSYMLSRGSNVSDILVYYGEDTNVTARYGKHSFPVPEGYNYDFIHPVGLADLKVRDGKIVTPTGAEYAAICLDCEGFPQSGEVASELSRLIARGAPVCTVENINEFLAEITTPDVTCNETIQFVHRKAGENDIYWIDNPVDTCITAQLSFRCCGLEPTIWNPETGEISPISYTTGNGRTEMSMTLGPDDAYFVVFGGQKAKDAFEAPQKAALTGNSIPVDNWTLEFPQRTLASEGLHSYTESDFEDVKYFSGTCVYSAGFNMDDVPERAILNLGKVCDLCSVEVNGEDLGVLWREPFQVDVTSFLNKGENKIVLRVVNVWVNRLIGDAQPDCPEVTTYTTTKFYNADSPLLPAGLLGPVSIEY